MEFTSYSLHLPTTSNSLQANPRRPARLPCVWEVLQREREKIGSGEGRQRDLTELHFFIAWEAITSASPFPHVAVAKSDFPSPPPPRRSAHGMRSA